MNNYFRNLIFSLIFPFLFGVNVLSAQLTHQLGDWMGHVSFRSVNMVEYDGESVYAVSSKGFYKYHIQNGEFTTISKVEGLSDINISAVKYDSKNDVFIIGYNSGVVDLVYKDEILSLNDIQAASGLSSRRINNIHMSGDTALLACDFGVVLVNVPKLEVQSTYFFGNSMEAVTVKDVAVGFDSIWVASDKGIFNAELRGTNLHNYQNWNRITSIPNDSASYSFVEKVGDKMFFVAENVNSTYDSIYMYKSNYLGSYYGGTYEVKRLEKRGEYITLIAGYNIRVFDELGGLISDTWFSGYGGSWNAAGDLVQVGDKLYIAERSHGLIKRADNEDSKLLPNAPFSNSVNQITSYKGNVYVAGGYPNARWSNFGFYKYNNQNWDNYNSRSIEELSDIPNINYLAIDKGDASHFFATSYGYGVLEFNDTIVTNIFNQDNSPLENYQDLPYAYILCSGIAYDNSGDIWVTTSLVPHTLYYYSLGGDWQAFDLEGAITNSTTRSLINTPWGHMWFVDQDYGLVVIDPEKLKSGDVSGGHKRFKVYGSDNNVLSNNITTIATDKNGYVWVGLDGGGLAVYYSPQSIFDYTLSASRIIVESDGIAQYLLDNEQVSVITVDAGNRKWVGTQSGGVFLISDDGTKQILNLNKDNSPLLSNFIRDIAVDDETGWVYFGTDEGIVSYHSGIIESELVQEKLKVYPNPVSENYNGLVRIEGLISDINVKISDVAGNIVFETTSTGAVALWNMKDFNGNRVSTGVYLIYATSLDGAETALSKIFIASNE